jgi:hypothetical protein
MDGSMHACFQYDDDPDIHRNHRNSAMQVRFFFLSFRRQSIHKLPVRVVKVSPSVLLESSHCRL